MIDDAACGSDEFAGISTRDDDKFTHQIDETEWRKKEKFNPISINYLDYFSGRGMKAEFVWTERIVGFCRDEM